MLLEMPDHDTLYSALLARSDAYAGQYFVGVTSTGIFCRLTCPARKPKPENCQFFDSVSACMSAGFRPCKRCHPLAPSAQADPMITTLINALEQDPQKRWKEGDLTAFGFDPSTVRRVFKRQYGISFLEMARLLRLRAGFETLKNGGPVINAQLEAGFESADAFRRAFASLMGVAPGALRQDAGLKADWIDTPLGAMIAICDETHLHLLEFPDRKNLAPNIAKFAQKQGGNIGIGRTNVHDQLSTQLGEFFNAKRHSFTIPLKMHGTDFTQTVWRALCDIPAGETRSYGELAQIIGNPKAVRAVARANASNQIALVIPCHRVIGADGTLTGYAGGLWRKQKLIEIEQNLRREIV